MQTSKTLILAAVTALTLGAGSAMAQTGVPAQTGNWAAPAADVPNQAPVQWGNSIPQVQSGTSDFGQPPNADRHAPPFSPWDYGTLANPG